MYTVLVDNFLNYKKGDKVKYPPVTGAALVKRGILEVEVLDDEVEVLDDEVEVLDDELEHKNPSKGKKSKKKSLINKIKSFVINR